MRRKTTAALAALIGLAFILPACREARTGDTYASIRTLFETPSAEYRPVPFWVWNDRMTENEIKEQLADLKARGMGGVFVHPRPGLITPYLTDEWFRLFRFAVETGKQLGLKVWIYDENSYPSGFAGGHVPAAMPDAVRTGLKLVWVEGRIGDKPEEVAAVFRRIPTGYKDVTAAFNQHGAAGLGAGSYGVVKIVKSGLSPWYAGFSYVDIMRKDVTDKFLDLTLNGYKKVIGPEFGAAVPGVFQDEAEISPEGDADTVNFSAGLFTAFQRKWGYDLRPDLISLFEPYGEWRRIRFNFYSTLLDMFIENWAKPYYAYCVDNNLIFTGHYWEHAWPVPRSGPDNLAMAAYAQMPGIDILMNRFDRGYNSQFGNARAVREIRSAANQFGRKRTLSETYGAGGWDLGFADQKRIGDWEYALGVNFLNQHLSYATIKGARKRDHPLSFSYHEPWWPLYNTMADYYARLSVVMSQGEQRNRILVIEPTTTAWMYYSPSGKNEKIARIGEDFQRFINLLEENHIEYDLASEKTMQESGSVEYKRFVVGRRRYELVVLPPGLENLTDSTLALLKEYLLHHGRILSWVAPPDFINGMITGDVRDFQRSYGDRWLNSGVDGMAKLREFQKGNVKFEAPVSDRWLFHQRRIFDGGQMLFLANTGLDASARGKVQLEGRSVEKWDPFTGAVEPYPFERRGGLASIAYDIPPGGSLLLCLKDEGKAAPAAPPAAESPVVMPASTGLTAARLGANVLTLDYCDLTLGGKTIKDMYFYEAQKKVYQYFGFEGDPWDNAVQYKTGIIDRDKFPADSGFEANFDFNAAKGDVFDYSSLKAVVERPEVFHVLINGREVKPAPGEWWLDRDFAVYPIGRHVVSGRNRITVKVRPFSVHAELEPVYLLGEFRLEPSTRGFVLRPFRDLRPGPWNEQGLPFYGGAVAYESAFVVDGAGPGAPAVRYVVELGKWSGAAAQVAVNGTAVGVVAFPPYTIDVTGLIKPGTNRVSVTVYGTLRNTLGPFHGDNKPGAAWPGDFKYSEPGGMPAGIRYGVLKYGLFEDFRLVELRAR